MLTFFLWKKRQQKMREILKLASERLRRREKERQTETEERERRAGLPLDV